MRMPRTLSGLVSHGRRQDGGPRARLADLRALRPRPPVGQPRQRAVDLPRFQHQSRRCAGRRPRDTCQAIAGERASWHRPRLGNFRRPRTAQDRRWSGKLTLRGRRRGHRDANHLWEQARVRYSASHQFFSEGKNKYSLARQEGLRTSPCRLPIPVFIWNLVLSTGGRFFDDGRTLG
jgi:hypothetical protein